MLRNLPMMKKSTFCNRKEFRSAPRIFFPYLIISFVLEKLKENFGFQVADGQYKRFKNRAFVKEGISRLYTPKPILAKIRDSKKPADGTTKLIMAMSESLKWVCSRAWGIIEIDWKMKMKPATNCKLISRSSLKKEAVSGLDAKRMNPKAVVKTTLNTKAVGK